MTDAFIQLFVTGGTFDKEYNYITGELYFKNTHLFDMMERGRCTLPVEISTLMMIDSLEMDDIDRKQILQNCQKTRSDKIVITHGTDTMVRTGAMLAEHHIDKTIILTGAMIPYAFGSSSDGFFNLGSSMAFAQALPHGVYIVMNGRCFNWDNVRKNKRTGFFECIKNTDSHFL